MIGTLRGFRLEIIKLYFNINWEKWQLCDCVWREEEGREDDDSIALQSIQKDHEVLAYPRKDFIIFFCC